MEGRKRVVTPRLAPSTDPFARRSANLVRLLLVEPDRPWRQKQLVGQWGLSQPRASKVLAALEVSVLDDEHYKEIASRLRGKDYQGVGRNRPPAVALA